jgi:hypothetical protein
LKKTDEKIKEVQAIIDASNNQSKIKSLFESIESLLTNIISQNTKTILSNSIQIRADHVAEHILKTWKNPAYPKDFLQTGLNLTKEEQADCVFCGQELNVNARQLLLAYSKLFSLEYTTLQSEISQAVLKFERWNPITFLESIQDKLATINLALNLEGIKVEDLKQLKDEITIEFAAKVKDIGHKVNFDKYDLLIQIFANIKLQIDELKSKNVFASEVNIEALKIKIREFEFSKIRHTKEWDDFLTEYDDIDSLQEIKKQKERSCKAAA